MAANCEDAAVLDAAQIHLPVMVERCTELLSVSLKTNQAVYLDGTLGMAGHAEAILTKNDSATLVGIDRDSQALDLAKSRLARFSSRIKLVQARYDQIDEVLAELGISKVDAILLDLGLSSLQIDTRARGFSYSQDAPLDMRMNTADSLTADQVVNEYPPAELSKIFSRYGEEKFASRIANAIVQARPIATSKQLVEVIFAAIPTQARYSGSHPAKRVFQALRIEVNQELQSLEEALPKMKDALNVGGRFVVLSYHSLEDRRVKQAFRAACQDQVPVDMPIIPKGFEAKFRPLTRGAEKPSAAEVSSNPRSASARLRAIERIIK